MQKAPDQGWSPTAIADPISAASYPTPAKRPANTVLDCAKIRGSYGIVLPDWRRGVDECVEAIRLGGWRVA
ncbi:MAG: sugar nucleotide-binding protein [Hyphomonadaceae bacterium]